MTRGNRYKLPKEVDANDERWESGAERSQAERGKEQKTHVGTFQFRANYIPKRSCAANNRVTSCFDS